MQVGRLRLRRGWHWVPIVVLGLMCLAALWPTGWLPHDPAASTIGDRLLPPVWADGGSSTHLLGTDHIGRDVFSRLVFASRYTLLIAIGGVTISCLLGTTAGLVAGYLGGKADMVISRLMDIQLALPAIILLIALVAVFGTKTTYLVIVLGVSGWAGFARVARSAALVVCQQEYVRVARGMGAFSSRIMSRHVLPNVSGIVLAYVSIDLARVVLLESSLSFLGLGVSPPGVTWGSMVADGRAYLIDAWWLAAVPGALIVVFIVALNAVGDSYTDLLDPRGDVRSGH